MSEITAELSSAIGKVHLYDDESNMRIVLLDSLPPETTGMLMALYSRDPSSVMKHLETIKKERSDSFMAKWYVKYGHKSIGDCSTISIFIEKVSMLTAKAIQDHALYSGQETSTRYVDMSKQPLIDPINTDESRLIHQSWMNFYNNNQDELYEYIKLNNPRKVGESEEIYNKTVKARVFDIMRGFLPAGLTTQLGWHTNVRQAYDKLHKLVHHPDPTIRGECIKILEFCRKSYPNSFNHKTYPETEEYYKRVYNRYTYHDVARYDYVKILSNIDPFDMEVYKDVLKNRPPKTELPTFLDDLGNVKIYASLDYGSFRDLARHRHGICHMPILDTRIGFHPWYLEQMPENMKKRATELIQLQKLRIDNLNASITTKQYYVAMGFQVKIYLSYGLPSFVYILELRSEKTVHPTLRKLCQDIRKLLDSDGGVDITVIGDGRTYNGVYPSLMDLYVDMDPDSWTIKRGTQDIVAKLDNDNHHC